jgi:hypothetical protein
MVFVNIRDKLSSVPSNAICSCNSVLFCTEARKQQDGGQIWWQELEAVHCGLRSWYVIFVILLISHVLLRSFITEGFAPQLTAWHHAQGTNSYFRCTSLNINCINQRIPANPQSLISCSTVCLSDCPTSPVLFMLHLRASNFIMQQYCDV